MSCYHAVTGKLLPQALLPESLFITEKSIYSKLTGLLHLLARYAFPQIKKTTLNRNQIALWNLILFQLLPYW